MEKLIDKLAFICIITFTAIDIISAQEVVVVRRYETDEVLTNPGKGFNTFQCFNGDYAGSAKTGYPGVGGGKVPNCLGHPVPSYKYTNDWSSINYPISTTAYFRLLWSFFEPQEGEYNWAFIDSILSTGRERGQTIILRIAPYSGRGRIEPDVPDWYRAMVGNEQRNYATVGKEEAKRKVPTEWWKIDHNDPRYLLYFGNMIRALGERYDGHPDMEAVDLSICGMAGEGVDTPLLEEEIREGLVKAYTQSFRKTPLIVVAKNEDSEQNVYRLATKEGLDVGWRKDCLGDIFGFSDTWNHMFDDYPQSIVHMKAQDAWKTAPVTFEACWTMEHWKEQGWDIDYIIDQSLKWHISTFNNKSGPVPEEWKPQVDRWLKRMGYRFVMRKFTYPSVVQTNGKIEFTSWWENTGVAPIYRDYTLAIRLENEQNKRVLFTDADITTWLPGDIIFNSAVFVPLEVPEGEYNIQIGIVNPETQKPEVNLAINDRTPEGWYRLGKIKIE